MKAVIEIARVGLEGQGVGYDPDGNIYFVPGGMPGDKLEVEFRDDAKRYRDAELLSVVTPSVNRQPSPCRYFGKCGGCDWLHWKYEAQLEAKDATLRHIFERNQIVPESHLPILASREVFGYRNRVQWRTDGRRIGFLERRSHSVVDIEKCEVAHPALNAALTELRQGGDFGLDSQKIEMAVQADGSVERWHNRPHGAGGFEQINSRQNEVLRGVVAEAVKETGAHRVLELFCGNGNLTFAFSSSVQAVLGVDDSEPAIHAARSDVPAAGAQITLLKAPVNTSLPRRFSEEWKDKYDTIVLDPPRQGAGDLRPLLHSGVKTVIYVSCAPVVFAKETEALKRDFRFVKAQGIDMFPHTHHIEFVATFVRR